MISGTFRASRLDWFRAGCATQTPIPHPVSGEIKINDLYSLPVDVLPNVYFRPVQQRMNADVRSRIKVGLELVPQLRRLILKVPLEVFVAWREISLFCPGSFFVPPDADNDSLIVFFFNDRLESILFQKTATFDTRNLPIREMFRPAPAPPDSVRRSD